ncbi:MAG: PHB depolymerase family esterase [Pseudohongiella sp.]|nr:PHB depolymerase family esterase [Pseudohongiella sp.]MDO9519952.1 PHB depolymerase family esterase [Pseudohongiella sp.]MDP2127115.1 PHB depolymerase family esterase [Pseudohongiella sp.]
MRFLVALIASVLSFTSLAQSSFSIDAGRGDVPLFVPSEYAINSPAPLIVLLHGYGSSGIQQNDYMRISELVERYGFVLATPDGTQETAGRNARFWNASDACCNFYATDLDDSAYVVAIINAVKAQYSIDDRRVYLIGHSNGGFMSYKTAHQYSDVIAGIASLAGAEATSAQPAPANPVHILQIHGTADGTIAYNGGDIQGRIYPSAEETVARWAAYNGCSVEGVVTATLDLDQSLAGLETTVTRFSNNCQPGGSAELWTIAEGAHIPQISEVFPEKVVEWLLARPKILRTEAMAVSQY